jgi:hypothetical protein
MSPVFKMMQEASSGFRKYVGRGFWHSMGAEPLELMEDGAKWHFFGRGIQTKQGRLGPKILEERFGTSATDTAFSLFALAGTAGMTLEGFATGGVMGGVSALAGDVAVNAAIVEHAYRYKKNAAGIRAVTVPASTLGKVRQGVGMFGRYSAGALGATALSGMAGGGPLGFAGSVVGGHIGVKHGGKIALLYGGYQAAKLTGNAVAGTLKAGHAFRQRQKTINTSGSIAAFNTQGAHTMRERAVQSIHKSHLNARSALGQEAQYMHFPSRNYNSRYR